LQLSGEQLHEQADREGGTVLRVGWSDDWEWREFWNEVLTVARMLERQCRPAKLNYQMLGNAVPS
jgi:hypothetical protein